MTATTPATTFGQRFKSPGGTTWDPTTGTFVENNPAMGMGQFMQLANAAANPMWKWMGNPQDSSIDQFLASPEAMQATGLTPDGIARILDLRKKLVTGQVRAFTDPQGNVQMYNRGEAGFFGDKTGLTRVFGTGAGPAGGPTPMGGQSTYNPVQEWMQQQAGQQAQTMQNQGFSKSGPGWARTGTGGATVGQNSIESNPAPWARPVGSTAAGYQGAPAGGSATGGGPRGTLPQPGADQQRRGAFRGYGSFNQQTGRR